MNWGKFKDPAACFSVEQWYHFCLLHSNPFIYLFKFGENILGKLESVLKCTSQWQLVFKISLYLGIFLLPGSNQNAKNASCTNEWDLAPNRKQIEDSVRATSNQYCSVVSNQSSYKLLKARKIIPHPVITCCGHVNKISSISGQIMYRRKNCFVYSTF